jgi:predicted nucleic acid-binding protein
MAKVDRFVLDASVTLAWCFEDERNAYSDAILQHMAYSKAYVPAIWGLEVSNVLYIAEKSKRISPIISANFLAALQSFNIIVEPQNRIIDLERLMAISRATSLTAYDSSYIELALKEGIALATTDNAMIDAAKTLNIKVL